MQKTKVMISNLGTAQRFEKGGDAMEVMSEYIYSGQSATPDPSHKAEIMIIVETFDEDKDEARTELSTTHR